jgi:FkbM family methyltransferase
MQRDLIYDVGMHRAEDTEFYLQKGFRVVAVEAMPELCDLAASRFPRQVQRRELTIINGAVSEGAGPATFYVNPNSEWGTIRPEWTERNERLGFPATRTIEVPVVSLSEVFDTYGVPYYLKVDIEGADMLCLKALADVAERPRYLSIESSKTSWRGLVAEFDMLRSLGYTRFKIVAQHRVPAQVCPSPSREGGFAERRFGYGSSGMFGEEAPGRWFSRRTALAVYRLIFLRYFLYGDTGILRRHWSLLLPRLVLRLLLGTPGWYDTHARHEG